MDEERKKKWKKRGLLAVLVAVVIYVILSLLTVSYEVVVTEESVVNESVPMNSSQVFHGEECEVANFSYAYGWDPLIIDAERGMMTPQLILLNGEKKTGIFKVVFLFIADDEFPFAEYNDSLEKVIPAVASPEQFVELSPGQKVSVVYEMPMPERERSYWVYGDITPPTMRFCQETQLTVTKENQSIVERKVQKERIVKKELPAIEYLWFIIRQA